MRSDREKGFNLSEAPLMRLVLIRLADDLYHLLWSSHHIQLDGWSQSLVLNDVFKAYRSLVSGTPVEFECSRPFADYVAYLKDTETVESETFWRERLRGFDEPTALGIERIGINDNFFELGGHIHGGRIHGAQAFDAALGAE